MLKENIATKETLTRGQQILTKLGIEIKPVNTVQELIKAKNYCQIGTPNPQKLTIK